MEIRTLKSFNVWVIYQINTLQHPMMSFCLSLDRLNAIWANFDLLVVCYYNKSQGRKLQPIWRQNGPRKRVKFANKNSIYSQVFVLNSQCKACSFSGCKLINHSFSFHCVNCTRSWNMTAKIEDIYAWGRKVVHFGQLRCRHHSAQTSNLVNYYKIRGEHNVDTNKLQLTHLLARLYDWWY